MPIFFPRAGRSGDAVTVGVLLAFAAFAAFSFSDASVKLINGGLPAYESAFLGALLGLVALPFVKAPSDSYMDIFHTENRWLWALRFLAYPAGVIGSVTAFTHLPMAEAFILIFLQPTFITIFARIFLKERTGPRRWFAVALGFVGVMVVLQPGVRPLTIGHLGALVAGLTGAVSVLSYRAVPHEKRLSLIGAGIIGGVIICGLVSIPGFVWPDPAQWAMLAGYGLFAALANVLMMYAAFRAPAALVSTTQYSQMLWAVLIDWVLFNHTITVPMLGGIALIVGSGILTLVREQARHVPAPRSMGGTTRMAPVTLPPTDKQDQS